MVTLSQSELIALINEVGAEAWRIYSVMRTLSTNDKLIIQHQQLADILKVVPSTLTRKMRPLKATLVEGKPLVASTRRADCMEYFVLALEIVQICTYVQNEQQLCITNTDNVKEPKEKIADVPKRTNAKPKQRKPSSATILDYFCGAFNQQYGFDYNVGDRRRAYSQIKTALMSKYDYETICRLVDFYVRSYDRMFRTQSFQTPTVGGLCVKLNSIEKYVLQQKQKPIGTKPTPEQISQWESKAERWGL